LRGMTTLHGILRPSPSTFRFDTMNILLTGGAGFIGFHATKALLARGHAVTGLDELNAYYDPALKRARLSQIDTTSYRFVQADIAARGALSETARDERYDVILH